MLEEAENGKELIKRPEILNVGPKPIRKFVKRVVENFIPKIKRNRAPRKYYSLTPEGEKFLQGLEEAWTELANTVNHLKRNQYLLS